MEADRRADFFGQLLDVPRVSVRNDDVAHLVAVGGNGLFLEPADREHASAQRDLTSHRDVAAHRHASESADHGGRDSDAGGGTVLRRGSRRHVDVDVPSAVEVRIDSECSRPRPRVRQCRRSRLFHDITESPGELDLAASAHYAHFDLQYLPSYLRVSEARGYTYLVVE